MDTARSAVIARLSGVHRRYNRGRGSVHALRGVDLEIRAGEFLAIVGPSGGGKSTVLSLLSGVDRPDEGTAELAGCELSSADESELVRLRREVVGVIFQAFHLMPNLTAEENVGLPLSLAGRPDAERVRELLSRVGLAERASHYPSELSGGEQQRVAVARALVHRPKIVVADEPTGNLDSASGARVLELLDELRRQEGAALVMATHDRDVAALADRRLSIRDGRIEEAS